MQIYLGPLKENQVSLSNQKQVNIFISSTVIKNSKSSEQKPDHELG